MKPAELGHIDIKMDIQADGKISTTVIVENERTLSLLQKDQSSLEKALDNSGLGNSGSNLNFSLKKHQQGQNQNEFAKGNQANAEENNLFGNDNDFSENVASRQMMKMASSDNAVDLNV